jgi:DNA polymerase III delta prime subunit
MNQIDFNNILNRQQQVASIKKMLADFEENKQNILFKKGIYVFGEPGTGKTTFVTNILKELDYDVIKYDAGDIRNASIIENITKHNMSDKNIMSLFNKKIRRIAIIMDEIDGMNNGDKGGINTLIKLIRPKKTKKQKIEESTVNPIICIGNYKVDKKIKELIKVCNVIELNTITPKQMRTVINELFSCNNNNNNICITEPIKDRILQYVQGDLRKLQSIYTIYLSNPSLFDCTMIENILQVKSYSDDTKKITHKLLNSSYEIKDHNSIMNETDRTSIGLLWHENIVDTIRKLDKKEAVPFYIEQLDNICFADYIDRVTFQKQIWQFNEMSSLIKTFKNNRLYHTRFAKTKIDVQDVRFTKVLTKYSTEYNNSLFIQKLCNKLGMDKKDLVGFFMVLKNNQNQSQSQNENAILDLLENYDIGKLDINRIYRYIEKYIKENAVGMSDKEFDEEEFCVEEEETV